MTRILGWSGLIIIGFIGAALTFGVLYLFAPFAPFLWALIVLPLFAGATIAALFCRLLAGRAGISRPTASLTGATIAIVPMSALVAAMLLSPSQLQAQPGPDPRGAHRLLKTAAGSSIAWWSIASDQPRHKTPVIFLHGGPGSFARNRDFVVGQGFRDAGFTTIFYDQAGSGASGNLPIAQYTVANAVADLDAVRVAAGADKIILWGQSWGASLAAAYVRAHPDRVSATILESPGDFPGEPYPLDYSKTDTDGGFQPSLRDATLFLLIGNAPQRAEHWQSQDEARAVQEARANKTVYIYGYQCKAAKSKLPRPLSPSGGNLFPQLRLQQDVETQPKVVGPLSSAPALLIRGECDFLPLETAARFIKAFPAAKRIDVAGRGHAFFGYEKELSAILYRYAADSLAGVP